ncbi:unnamed protein product [Oppiella nova]|uniref:Potassium voltage-gated channel subfamily KQT member 1 n=1 Tax=Oppiella nova TaxID=334625 RepID=A0A7R9M7M9_9ACAR|nr:unnamed protein product [Oppiella nova]CAG2172317.1 unnamed protein product [Oppiella nova]
MTTQCPEYSHFVAEVESQDTITSREQVLKKTAKPLQSMVDALHFCINIKRSGIIGADRQIDPKRSASLVSEKTVKWLRRRAATYKFLHDPNGPIGRLYHIMVSCLVMLCLLLTILCTFAELPLIHLNLILYGVDLTLLIIFALEYMARFWASDCVSYYRGFKGKLRFVINPFRVIDLLVIISSILIIAFNIKDGFLTPSLKGVRFFQTFKLVRLEHQFRPWRVMASVIWQQREHLYITTYCSFLALIFMAFTVYYVEKDFNPKFNNLGESLWYTVVSLCTIGYGDIVPVTAQGKVLASICTLVGVSVFALPAGILGTGLALKVQEQQRLRQKGKRLIPAIRLIQTRWRCHHFYKHPLNPDSLDSTSLNPTSLSPPVAPVIKLSKKVRKKDFNKIEKICMRFVLKTKFFVAQRHFSQALKPYDVRDVLEQYSAGHQEMLSRVKQITSKVTGIEAIAEGVSKTQNESKSILNYRLCKVEDALRETDVKLSEIMKIQTENKVLYENILEFLENNSSKA